MHSISAMIFFFRSYGLYFQEHFQREDYGEDVVEAVEELSLERPGRDVGPLHGQRDAVGGDEDQHDEVEPVAGSSAPRTSDET